MNRIAAAFVVSLFATVPGVAQDRGALVEAISGEWYAFDIAARAGEGPCQLQLATTAAGQGSRMGVSILGCRAPLADVAAWDVEGAQLVFYSEAGARMAELGGSQQRMTGAVLSGGDGVILERQSGDNASAALARAIQRHRCFYLGYTSDCAAPEDLARPAFDDDADSLAEVELLVELAVRSQPRRDGALIGTIPAETCVSVDQCLNASDGLWCRAWFGETLGWLGKSALRQNEWPVVTYRAGCTAEN